LFEADVVADRIDDIRPVDSKQLGHLVVARDDGALSVDQSIMFFITTLATFFERIWPASSNANPGCMKNTMKLATSTQTALMLWDISTTFGCNTVLPVATTCVPYILCRQPRGLP